MFKTHFGRKTKLADLLAANLVFSVRRMGSRFLGPNMSSQWCLSCDSCPFPHPPPPPRIPLRKVLEYSRGLQEATTTCLLQLIPCREQA